MNREALRHGARATALVLLAMAAALVGLNSLGSHHGDEANYIEVAAHMLESGNYLVPVFHGKLVLDRAPLFYWMIALSFRVFGISLWAARLPEVVAMGLTAILVYAFTLRTYGSARGALYAAVALLSSGVTCSLSRLAVPDMTMTFGSFLALAAYYTATVSSRRRRWLFVASIGVGIAAMAKGHVGIVVALLPLVVHAVLVDRAAPQRLRWRELIAPSTWLPGTVLAGWWYLYLLTSSRLVGELAPSHHLPTQTLAAALVEFMSGEILHQAAAGWRGLLTNLQRYPIGLVAWFFPWSLCIAAGFLTGQRFLRREWQERPRETKLLLSLIVSIVLLFAFLILEVRSDRYLLPIAPAVGILASRFLVRREDQRERTPAALIAGVTLLLLAHALLGIVAPLTIRPPLENLCRLLKPTLNANDTVWAAQIGDKWATFAMAMLGHPVIDARDAADLDAQFQPHDRGDGVHYVLATAKAAEHLLDNGDLRFRVLAQGTSGVLAEKWALWDALVLLQAGGVGQPDLLR